MWNYWDTASCLRVLCFVSADSGICCALHSDYKVMKEAVKILCDIVWSIKKDEYTCPQLFPPVHISKTLACRHYGPHYIPGVVLIELNEFLCRKLPPMCSIGLNR